MKHNAFGMPIIPEEPILDINIIMSRLFLFPPHNQLFIDITIILNHSFDLVV